MDNEKFQNRYRIPSARLQNWDYSANAEYFITICTANRECLFGKIENGEMFLSGFGKIVDQEWGKSFEMRKELFCDAFVIMPNHCKGLPHCHYKKSNIAYYKF
jgi:REP element-mobilizing transposase RayT